MLHSSLRISLAGRNGHVASSLAGRGRGALPRLDEVVNAAEFPLVVAYSGLDREAARLGQRPAERRGPGKPPRRAQFTFSPRRRGGGQGGNEDSAAVAGFRQKPTPLPRSGDLAFP